MLNAREIIVLLKDKNQTQDISRIVFNQVSQKYEVTFKTGRTYQYHYQYVEVLENPQKVDAQHYAISKNGFLLKNIKELYRFSGQCDHCWTIVLENGTVESYAEKALQIEKSCLADDRAKTILDYLKQTAEVVSIKAEDGTKLLSAQYEKMNFLSADTAAAVYLNPEEFSAKKHDESIPIFPFGCNASQYIAVKKALENQLSVIEGPPGTGKTQTILNIIANLLIQGKTVQVVSNNNVATMNVFEKLDSPQYDMGFLVATLGNTKNKQNFIHQQTGKYPNFKEWQLEDLDEMEFFTSIKVQSEQLSEVFQRQERLAIAKQELHALELEQKHFEIYTDETTKVAVAIKLRNEINAEKVLLLWQTCQGFFERKQKISMFFRLKAFFLYGIVDWRFFNQELTSVILYLQGLFYQVKQKELKQEIETLTHELLRCDAKEMAQALTQSSMAYLKHYLFEKYGKSSHRCIFQEDALWKRWMEVQKEYPVVLSTTFSSRSSLTKHAVFDYVIMDEASQVDVATGALGLSCAKNAVIVGDAKQLPNVIPDKERTELTAIFNLCSVLPCYDFVANSFLESVVNAIGDIPKTLLREHYRCHPKIIEFCNQKFYGGELVVMTSDNGEDDVLSVYKTVKGNHQRERMNQRQIDVLTQEVLPNLSTEDRNVGVITPYNDQVNAIERILAKTEIDVATVHKFQGREKDVIILSTVDDVIGEFVDDPNMLNVAVSRAKQKLVVIVSGNEQPENRNIVDLIGYVAYQNCKVVQSEIFSVFDYLYGSYTKQRQLYLQKCKAVSEYDSENLMFALLEKILKLPSFCSLKAVCHYPLHMLIRDPKRLNDEECDYAMNPYTHLDFLIYNFVAKKPVLVIEVDGVSYHKEGTRQAERDKMKNHILDLYQIPYIRFATNGSGEEKKVIDKLNEIM